MLRAVAHGDVDENAAGGGIEIHGHGLGFLSAAHGLALGVEFGRMNLELVAAIVEQRDSIADDHVGKLADGLTDNLLGCVDFASSESGSDADGGG